MSYQSFNVQNFLETINRLLLINFCRRDKENTRIRLLIHDRAQTTAKSRKNWRYDDDGDDDDNAVGLRNIHVM